MADFIEWLRNDNEGEVHLHKVLFLFAGLGWYYVILRGELVPPSAFVSFRTGFAARSAKSLKTTISRLGRKGTGSERNSGFWFIFLPDHFDHICVFVYP